MAEYLNEDELARARTKLDRINEIFSSKIVGQEGLRECLVAGLLSGGHILIESVPGLAKTTAAQTLAASVSGSFRRIQCTPDLMPNDIVGMQIWNQAAGEMTTQLGPVHANFVLLDEINRSSAKTQSAMLEAMQEAQTTIGGVNYPLPSPFMVMATQNPIEEEGTYVLPEAQMDRFVMKQVITYPQPREELEVLERIDSGVMRSPIAAKPISIDDLVDLQQLTKRVFVHSTLKAYIVDLINTSRGGGPKPLPDWNKHVRVGASPRGGIALMHISQAVALMDGRHYVIPEDIKKLRHSILRHRIIRTFDALADDVLVEGLIDAVFSAVPVP
ncbi:AAA family ATPase [Actinomyces mediterranea]|uniref:AAA family ATPase n=1 Tax=Actinomyces mediterranea TaxID=1871028 RepID=UPI000970BFEA|nr:AAA family ATPase [Actinomyces mediterranea]